MAGFTLIELLISIAIIGIISAIVLIKYSAFDGTILLKGQAYEVALALREAQVRSVSVVRSGGSFENSYGTAFLPGTVNGKQYVAFLSTLSSGQRYYNLDSMVNASATFLQSFLIPRSIYISDICVTPLVAGVAQSEVCYSTSGVPNLVNLSVSFHRPEYKAIFYGVKSNNVAITDATNAKIKLSSSAGGTTVFVVTISYLGQISVSKQ